MAADIYVVGGGGHAAAVIDTLVAAGRAPKGVFDPSLPAALPYLDIPVLGGDEAMAALDAATVELCIGVGVRPGENARIRLVEKLEAQGWRIAGVRHPGVQFSARARTSASAQLLAGVVVQARARIADHVIVNTGATVDHDCDLAAHAFVGPNATLCGGVVLGRGAFVGAGAVILPYVKVGEGAVVAAGAVVREEVPAEGRVAGNPAKRIS
jgi:UDP-perosamine 4-acetyltransferase